MHGAWEAEERDQDAGGKFHMDGWMDGWMFAARSEGGSEGALGLFVCEYCWVGEWVPAACSAVQCSAAVQLTRRNR